MGQARITIAAGAQPLRLRGRRLLLARGAWIVTTTAAIVLLIVSVPLRYDQLLHNTGLGAIDPAPHTATLQVLGFSAPGYAAYNLTLELLLVSGFLAVGLVLFWRKSDEWPPLLFGHLLIMTGIAATGLVIALEAAHPALTLVVEHLRTYGIFGLFLFAFLFPDGRFVPRWTWLPALVWLAVNTASVIAPGSAWDVETWPRALDIALLVLVVGSLPVATIYRYRRVSNVVQRQQTKWVMFSLSAAVAINLSLGILGEFVPVLSGANAVGVSFRSISDLLTVLVFLLIPLSVGVAVLRSRLWEIDPVINRTLVYGALTLSVISVYALIVSSLSMWFQTSGNLLISLLATGVVVVLFQPLQIRLQYMINHLMYGDRDDPYRVLSRLGQQLEATLTPEAVLPTIVETVKDALHLPYAAIALDHDGIYVTAAAAGDPVADPLVLPLQHQGEVIGQLILGPRASGDSFSAADHRLLGDLVRQIGVAVQTQRLAVDLQRSRERLVTAREEERRRLRRDLHDGLGPALAAQTLKVGAARALYGRNPAAADKLLAELETDIEAALHEIRRLVYNLRPPALDELGLVGAIREELARTFGAASDAPGLRVMLDAPERLPTLPAALEVTAYRIVQEALANVARHACAQECIIRLRLEQDHPDKFDSMRKPLTRVLMLEVVDDGIGLPATRTPGVGLQSMRERAAELGGSCVIDVQPGGGTVVRARLPLDVVEASDHE